MTVYEPVTFATDLALGALTAVFAAKLLRRGASLGSSAMRLWGAAFVASAAAAILGGFYHGFAPTLGKSASGALWTSTLYLGGATSLFLLASALVAATGGRVRQAAVALVTLKAIAYALWVTRHAEFRWLVYDYGAAMVGVAALQFVRRGRARAPGAEWILSGIAASFLAALVQQSGFVLHAHFNHNDLYHVLQMGATALLYRGGRSLPDDARPASQAPPIRGGRELHSTRLLP